LEQAIQHLYEIFAKYDKPRDFPACQCCLSENEKARLLNGRLKDLSADELSEYAADIFLTVGEVADFKYFLRRILEISVKDEFLWPDPEVVLSKLSKAGWENWSEDERLAVIQLLQDKFNELLNDPASRGSDIDQWVCALGHCVEDLTPYLARMLEASHRDKLLSYVEENLSAYSKNRLSNAFWDSARANEQHVIAWLNQQTIKDMLSERYGMRF